MRILVTGGTGFVGPSIVQALVDAGHTVRVLEHESGRSAELPSQEAVQGDVTDPASLRRAPRAKKSSSTSLRCSPGRPRSSSR